MRRMLMLCVTLVAITAVVARAEGPNLIVNGDFAVDSNGDGLADRWAAAGEHGGVVSCTRDQGAREGYSQKLAAAEGSRPGGSVMLLQQDTVVLKKGYWYRLTCNVKGETDSGAASVAIQQTGPWRPCGLWETFRIEPEWRVREFVFRATRSIAKNVRLQFWFEGLGAIWLDGVRLVEIGAEEPASAKPHFAETVPESGAKNLVPNGSFEAGAGGWGSMADYVGWGNSLGERLGQVEATTAVDGRHSYRIDVNKATAPVLAWDYFDVQEKPVLRPLLANRGWIPVTPNHPYTLSAYVKSSPAGTPCALAYWGAFQDVQTKEFTATGKWQRLSMTFTPKADQLYIGVGPDLRNAKLGKATLWIDAVQLEQGSHATAYEPHATIEVGLEWPRPGHLFTTPKAARATVTVANAGSQPQRVQVRAEVTDLFDKAAASPEVVLQVPAGGSVREELPLGVTDKGYYQLRLKADRGTVLSLLPERFGVVDPHPDRQGLFGMNHAYADDVQNRVSREIGLTWFRDWSLKWHQVEPEKGHFQFGEMDYEIDRIRAQGLNVLGLLPFPSSDWSTSAPAALKARPRTEDRPTLSYMPRDLNEFADYVRTTVQHYRGRIHVWEILNEPLFTSYALPASRGYHAADYVRLLKVAYRAVKEADPSAFVIGGIAGSPLTYTKEFIAAGGLDWIDGINIHVYPGLRRPESFLPELESLNAMMRQAGKPKPIYATEGSYYADDDLPLAPATANRSDTQRLDSELECASDQARYDIILLSQNGKLIIYHSGTAGTMNYPSPNGIFFEWDEAPRKMAITQSVLTSLFGADTKYLGSVWPGVQSFAFQSRGRTVVAVWDEKRQGHELTVPREARVIDLAGATVRGPRVTVDENPHYLIIDGTHTLSQVREMGRDWLR